MSLYSDERKGIPVSSKYQLTERQKAVLKAYQRGKRTHILINGMLSWGLVTGMIFLTIQTFWNRGFSVGAWSRNVFSMYGLTTLLIFMACGSLWGIWTWKQIEKNAASIKQSRSRGKPKKQTG